MLPIQRDRAGVVQCRSQGAGLEKSFRMPVLERAGASSKAIRSRYCLPETRNNRWSSKVCSAAAQALSRMNSVRDLCEASAARRKTVSCSLDARRPKREERRLDAFFRVDETAMVILPVRVIYVQL